MGMLVWAQFPVLGLLEFCSQYLVRKFRFRFWVIEKRCGDSFVIDMVLDEVDRMTNGDFVAV